jgi:hypothetical protein
MKTHEGEKVFEQFRCGGIQTEMTSPLPANFAHFVTKHNKIKLKFPLKNYGPLYAEFECECKWVSSRMSSTINLTKGKFYRY